MEEHFNCQRKDQSSGRSKSKRQETQVEQFMQLVRDQRLNGAQNVTLKKRLAPLPDINSKTQPPPTSTGTEDELCELQNDDTDDVEFQQTYDRQVPSPPQMEIIGAVKRSNSLGHRPSYRTTVKHIRSQTDPAAGSRNPLSGVRHLPPLQAEASGSDRPSAPTPPSREENYYEQPEEPPIDYIDF